MSTAKIVLVGLLAGVLGVGVAIVTLWWSDAGRDLRLPPTRAGDGGSEPLDGIPDIRLPDLQGREIASTAWAGKVIVLNFWATWCPPCVRELPVLDALQRAQGNADLQVVGIAIDEKENVERFLAEHPVGFPILLGDTGTVALLQRLGNRVQGLPFTVIFDHQGNRVHQQTGEVTRTSLDAHLTPLLSRDNKPQTPGNEPRTHPELDRISEK